MGFGSAADYQPDSYAMTSLVIYISVIYVQLILSGHSRYVNPGSTESDEIGGLITNDRWFLLGWFSSFGRHTGIVHMKTNLSNEKLFCGQQRINA